MYSADEGPTPWLGGEVRAEGLVLRSWDLGDVPTMVRLFDTPDIDRWTPLAHPFDEDAATAYVRAAWEGRSTGTLQLAVTYDGGEPLGEVLLFGTEEDGTCELAYAVGCEHRGQGLAVRSVRAALRVAHDAGHVRARLRIAVGNRRSEHVALCAGFALTGEPVQHRRRKGRTLSLRTWRRADLQTRD
ncbi:MAG: GNAT family N-acetyltransferase [Propionibacteriales bacterium]|nr:GNAT family N-acetyltransferase [Propionibacteriales bacterium]